MSDRGAEDHSDEVAAPGSIDARRAARQAAESPTHPKLAATLLMLGIVVLLFAIAAAPLLGR